MSHLSDNVLRCNAMHDRHRPGYFSDYLRGIGPLRACGCGCGEPVRSLRARYLPSHHNSPRHDYVVAPSGCWIWQRKVTSKGYGLQQFEGREIHAHRWMWARERGEIPADHDVHHLCGVRRCVNPDHLEPIERGEHRRLHWQHRKGAAGGDEERVGQAG